MSCSEISNKREFFTFFLGSEMNRFSSGTIRSMLIIECTELLIFLNGEKHFLGHPF